ncbi:MAG: hypothetical protein E6K81_05395 [Candidatus Eisenbacteria bacterium]|uniref:Carboxymuconolactone decarboxylase-like domain-containing protein n=1 Tax=Eiseniibacteriota bacterium TaxID=2212470 RepID=A0A538UBA8_UNCEI|nr:MAG: hypothetical protein E6K81_05395 [Candidatus Eisenbacteria bacterium]
MQDHTKSRSMPSLSRPEAPLSWIPVVEPDQAPAPLAALYERIRTHSSRGRVANLWRAMGQHPASLAAAFDHYRALMDDPAPLTKAQAELLALVVSATNGCSYCVAHHGPRLAKALGDEALARAVARACEPAERKQEDIDRLREYGFDDAAILRATEIAAFYGLINRVVCGLGVTLEPDVPAWEFGSQK